MKKLYSKSWLVTALAAATVLSVRPVNATVVNGQADDFEDGTLMNWAGSFIPATAPQNIGTGGPSGVGDNYLQITSSGGVGPGSKLATYNSTQWAGDYTSAGVTSVDFDVRNFSADTIELRILLFGSGGEFTSTVSTPVLNDGLWHHLTLGIGAGDLSPIDGANPLDLPLTLADVTRLMIRHQDGDPGEPPAFVGQMGLDNITATPEPATLALLVISGLSILRRRR